MIGLGGGLAKLDPMALNMAQLKAKVEEINRKLDVVLEAPLGQAVELLEMVHPDRGHFAKIIKELEKVKDHAERRGAAGWCTTIFFILRKVLNGVSGARSALFLIVNLWQVSDPYVHRIPN